MKRKILITIMGLCCVFCMAQPLDRARIENEWGKITTYCCAQYEIDYLSAANSSIPCEDVVKKLKLITIDKGAFSIDYIKSVSKSLESDPFIGKFELYFDSLGKISTDKLQSWEALFPIVENDQYSTKNKAGELRESLTTAYLINEKKWEGDNNILPSVSVIEIVLIVLVVLTAIVLLIVLIKISKLHDDIYSLRNRIHNVEGSVQRMPVNKERVHSNSNADAVADLSSRIGRLESVVMSMQSKSSSAKVVSKEEEKEVETETIVETSVEKTNHEDTGFVVFLKNFNAGIMKECLAAEAQYELVLSDKQSVSGEFVFVGDVNAALATKDATFEDVCDLENWNMSSKSCTTVEKGKAEKMSDGKWRVVKKGKVKFS